MALNFSRHQKKTKHKKTERTVQKMTGGSLSETNKPKSKSFTRILKNKPKNKIKHEKIHPLYHQLHSLVQNQHWGNKIDFPDFENQRMQGTLRNMIRHCNDLGIIPESFLPWAISYPNIRPEAYLGWITSPIVMHRFLRSQQQQGSSQALTPGSVMLDGQGRITLDPEACSSHMLIESPPIFFQNAPQGL